jgi:hypothetical protein
MMSSPNQGENSYSLDGAATKKDRDINTIELSLNSLVTNLFNLILLEFLSFLLKMHVISISIYLLIQIECYLYYIITTLSQLLQVL